MYHQVIASVPDWSDSDFFILVGVIFPPATGVEEFWISSSILGYIKAKDR